VAFVKITEFSKLKEGKIHPFSLRDRDLAIVRKGETVYAFEDVCSHDGGAISDGEIVEDRVICPRHFAEFSILTGEALTMPATEKISVFPTRVVGDSVEVDLE